jgi:ion channel-forming bestrophin family protein
VKPPGYRTHWLALVFAWRGTALPRIKLRLAAVLLVAIVSSYLQETGRLHVRLTATPFTLVGLALGIFLGFRNNTSYDRFWEARKLWGALVNTSRTFARQVLAFLPPEAGGPSAAQRELVHWIVAYVHALAHHLRGGVNVDELAPWLGAAERGALADHRNVPSAILLRVSARLRQEVAGAGVSEFLWVELERRLAELTDIQGGCERIKGTPIPYSYSVLLHRIVALYVFALPFGLVETLHALTPIVVMIVAYTFLALDAVGDELEDPFGTEPNDLPLATLARAIEINLRQALGEREVPAPLEPVDGFLQ